MTEQRSPSQPDRYSAAWSQAGRRMAQAEKRLIERDEKHFTGSYDWIDGLNQRHSKHIFGAGE